MNQMDSEVSQLSFQHFVGIIFNNWTALKLAIDHGMGGPPVVSDAKVNRMIDTVTSLLSSGSEWETVADTLAVIMDDEFSTVLDDNSSDEVGFQLCQLYQMFSLGNLQELSASMSHLPNTTPINLNRVQPRSTQNPAEEEIGQSQSSKENIQSIEEDLEWTVVKRR